MSDGAQQMPSVAPTGLDVRSARGLAVGVASSGRPVAVDWAFGLALQSYPVNTNIAYMHVIGDNVASARERIVEEALRLGTKYLWFIDDDTVPPRDAARKLMFVLDQAEARGEPVVACGGIYCTKDSTPTPLVFLGPGQGAHWGWKVGDVFPVWGIGTGCLMIRTSAFVGLSRPWFKTIAEPDMSVTDDLYLCDKLADAGLKVMAHGGVLCRHWDVSANIVYSLPTKSYPMLPREPLTAAPEFGKV